MNIEMIFDYSKLTIDEMESYHHTYFELDGDMHQVRVVSPKGKEKLEYDRATNEFNKKLLEVLNIRG